MVLRRQLLVSMKQQCTERGRDVLNEALDIHGGAWYLFRVQ